MKNHATTYLLAKICTPSWILIILFQFVLISTKLEKLCESHLAVTDSIKHICVYQWQLDKRTCPICKMDISKHYGLTGDSEMMNFEVKDESLMNLT